MGKTKEGKRKKDKETDVPSDVGQLEGNPTELITGQDGELPIPRSPEVRLEVPSTNVREELAETSAAKENSVPSAQVQWDAMKSLSAQIAVLTKTLASEPAMQSVRTDTPSERVEVALPSGTVRQRGDYLNLLEHVSKLGTRHFTGTTNPIIADEWKSRLMRNFSSTRCPEEYRRDIAVHFLEGDAHTWWITVEKRNVVDTFSDFLVEFDKKYFPPEAWDRLECQYLELVQGTKTVREYDEVFCRLRRYVGRELEDEQAQIRRFIRGLRVQIRNHLLVRTFTSVSEVVERAAMIEIGIEEEEKMKQDEAASRISKSLDRKRKWDKPEEGTNVAKRDPCKTCGKFHGGTCWKANEICGRCGSKDHGTQSCPRGNQGQPSGARGETRVCYLCNQAGHVRRDCPQVGGMKRTGPEALPPPPKRQAVTPRVYELSEEAPDAGNFHAISGK